MAGHRDQPAEGGHRVHVRVAKRLGVLAEVDDGDAEDVLGIFVRLQGKPEDVGDAQGPVQELLECKLNGIRVSDALTYFERETGKVKLDLLYPSWMIFSEGFVGNRLQSITGRIFDIVSSLILLLLTWPIMVTLGWNDLNLLRIRLIEGRMASLAFGSS